MSVQWALYTWLGEEEAEELEDFVMSSCAYPDVTDATSGSSTWAPGRPLKGNPRSASDLTLPEASYLDGIPLRRFKSYTQLNGPVSPPVKRPPHLRRPSRKPLSPALQALLTCRNVDDFGMQPIPALKKYVPKKPSPLRNEYRPDLDDTAIWASSASSSPDVGNVNNTMTMAHTPIQQPLSRSRFRPAARSSFPGASLPQTYRPIKFENGCIGYPMTYTTSAIPTPRYGYAGKVQSHTQSVININPLSMVDDSGRRSTPAPSQNRTRYTGVNGLGHPLKKQTSNAGAGAMDIVEQRHVAAAASTSTDTRKGKENRKVVGLRR